MIVRAIISLGCLTLLNACGTSDGFSRGLASTAVSSSFSIYLKAMNCATCTQSGSGTQSSPNVINGFIALDYFILKTSGTKATSFSCTSGANWSETFDSSNSEIKIDINIAPPKPSTVTCRAVSSVGIVYYYMTWT